MVSFGVIYEISNCLRRNDPWILCGRFRDWVPVLYLTATLLFEILDFLERFFESDSDFDLSKTGPGLAGSDYGSEALGYLV